MAAHLRLLHVSYILLQLLVLCEYPCTSDDFEGLKSVDLVLQCDQIWRDLVCKQLQWKYNPTI